MPAGFVCPCCQCRMPSTPTSDLQIPENRHHTVVSFNPQSPAQLQQMHPFSKCWKKERLSTQNSVSFKNAREINTFSDKRKLREITATICIQEVLYQVFQVEVKRYYGETQLFRNKLIVLKMVNIWINRNNFFLHFSKIYNDCLNKIITLSCGVNIVLIQMKFIA